VQSTVISACNNGTIWVWDMNLGETSMQLEGHKWCAKALALSADGSRLLSGSWDGTLRCGRDSHPLLLPLPPALPVTGTPLLTDNHTSATRVD
jgi:WD40 repeat protein